MLRSVELVYICIEHEESVDVPECAHELALTLDNSLAVEAVGQPGSGVGVEIPANRVRTVGVERVERVNGVALGLRHLLSVLILNVAENKNVFIGRSVEQQGRNGEQRIEPASRLIDSLGNKLRRELLLEQVVIFKRIVVLREGHRAGVEPAVDNFGHAVHLAAALRHFIVTASI